MTFYETIKFNLKNYKIPVNLTIMSELLHKYSIVRLGNCNECMSQKM